MKYTNSDQEIAVGDTVEVVYRGEVTGHTGNTIFVRSLAGLNTVEHHIDRGMMEVRVVKRALPTEDGLYVEAGDERALTLYRLAGGEWSVMTPFYVFPKATERARRAHECVGLVRLVPSDREQA